MARRRLGEILVEEAIVAPGTVERALEVQARVPRRKLGQLLMDEGSLDQNWLTAALALQAEAPTVDPLAMEVDPGLLWRIPPDVAERVGAFVARDAMGPILVVQDPADTRTLRSLGAMLGIPDLRVAVGLPDRVGAAITRHYDTTLGRSRRIRGVVGETRPALTGPTSQSLDTRQMLGRLARGGDRAPADFGQALLVFAVETAAERLVLDSGQVRVSHDGIESTVMELPALHALPVSARLRGLLHLDPVATRPAGADARLPLGERTVRVVARSTGGGAGGRLELAFPETAEPTQGGMHPRQAAAWKEALAAPGLVLVAADELPPTLEAPDRVERRSLTDWSSVDSAVRAAQTGKTILATLPASGVADALARLRDLAPSRPAAAGVLRAVLAVRRVRKVCSGCALPAEADPVAAERLGVPTFAAPRPGTGCPECGYRRYRGSFWGHELVVVSPALRDALDTGAALGELGRLAAPVADRTLQVDGAARAIEGETTAAELERALPPRAPWADRGAGDRHRGLVRAVTDLPSEPVPVDAADDTAELPLVVLVGPTTPVVRALGHALRGRAAVLPLDADQARTPATRAIPAIGVLAHDGPLGWSAELMAEWHSLGTHIVLLGPDHDLARMTEAFELGATEYAGSPEELGVRIGRWLPRVESAAPELRVRS